MSVRVIKNPTPKRQLLIKNGQSIRQNDLLIAFKSKIFFPGWYRPWVDDFTLNKNHLMLTTTERQINFFGYIIQLGYQEIYTFDVKTGRILKKQIKAQLLKMISKTLIFIFLLFIL